MSFRNVFGVSGVREKAASIHTSDGGSFHGAVGLRVSTLTRVDFRYLMRSSLQPPVLCHIYPFVCSVCKRP